MARAHRDVPAPGWKLQVRLAGPVTLTGVSTVHALLPSQPFAVQPPPPWNHPGPVAAASTVTSWPSPSGQPMPAISVAGTAGGAEWLLRGDGDAPAGRGIAGPLGPGARRGLLGDRLVRGWQAGAGPPRGGRRARRNGPAAP